MTSMDGVFAAGDIVRGASLVVWAVRDGRDVADRMHAWLKAKAKGDYEAREGCGMMAGWDFKPR
jgi:glutamate synthase (NADPH/NADH) small chain